MYYVWSLSDIMSGLLLFSVFINLDFILFHKDTKKNLANIQL